MTMDSLLLWVLTDNSLDDYLVWSYIPMWWDDCGEYVVLDIDHCT